MMLDEAAGLSPVIDFLHPRKKPAPPDKRRTYATAIAAIAAVVLIAFGFMQWRLWNLDSQIRVLTANRTKGDKLAKDSAKPIKDAELLDAFAAGDVTWLDELARISEKLPPNEAAMVTELNATTLPKAGGGTIKLVGRVDKSDRVAALEDGLRDKQHTVSGKGTTQDQARTELQWTFDELITVAPPNQKPPPAAAPTAKTDAAKTGATKAPTAKPGAQSKQGGAQ
jgi:hypothetical protein